MMTFTKGVAFDGPLATPPAEKMLVSPLRISIDTHQREILRNLSDHCLSELMISFGKKLLINVL
jgi:hypothetical protein